MTKEESLKSLIMFNTIFEKKDMSDLDAEIMLNVWQNIFQEVPYFLVEKSILQLVSSFSGYGTPKIYDVKKIVDNYIETANGGMSKEQEWNKLSEMVHKYGGNDIYYTNSIYTAAKQFEDLPKSIQEFLGSVDGYKQICNVESSEYSIQKSIFLKNADAIKERVRFNESLEPGMREALKEFSLDYRLKQLEEKNEV